jgi:hypothetical protein
MQSPPTPTRCPSVAVKGLIARVVASVESLASDGAGTSRLGGPRSTRRRGIKMHW